MIRFLSIASGSKGNATLIYDEKTLFQIDMGVSLKLLRLGLNQIQKSLEQIEMVFITHEHSDHIKGLDYLTKRNLPIFASEKTPISEANHFEIGETFHLGDFYIAPFPLSHDASDPVGYLILHNDESLVYLTDTGEIAENVLSLLKNRTYYVIESNHDLKMLLKSHRPMSLKKRIHGEFGHLSNAESAQYASRLIGDKTKGVYLAHLSEECNRDDIALATYRDILKEHDIDLRKLTIKCLHQHEMTLGGDDEN